MLQSLQDLKTWIESWFRSAESKEASLTKEPRAWDVNDKYSMNAKSLHKHSLNTKLRDAVKCATE